MNNQSILVLTVVAFCFSLIIGCSSSEPEQVPSPVVRNDTDSKSESPKPTEPQSATKPNTNTQVEEAPNQAPAASPAATPEIETPDTGMTDANPETTSLYSFTADSISEQPVNLKEYENKVVLIVNVASKCGFTKQYAGLQELYEKHKDDGLVILGFPCNQFGKQERGTNAEIQQFCTLNFGVSFPMFAKIEVNGSNAHPLYQWLTGQDDKKLAGPIKWNFTKFLIDRTGQPVARYDSRVKPNDPKLVNKLEVVLKNKS